MFTRRQLKLAVCVKENFFHSKRPSINESMYKRCKCPNKTLLTRSFYNLLLDVSRLSCMDRYVVSFIKLRLASWWETQGVLNEAR